MVTLDQAGRDPGLVESVRRNTELGAFVELLSLQRRDVPFECARKWRIVADDAPHIVLQATEDGKGTVHRVLLVGARRIHTDIDASRRSFTLAARLHPGALAALFGFPASDLTDVAYPLDEAGGSRMRGAVERLITEAAEAPFPAMVRFLSSILPRARPIDARVSALSQLATDQPAVTMDAVARTFGMGTRGLRSLVYREAGMSPKRLMRIRRLHRAFVIGARGLAPSWTAAALDAGYFDQAHFVHECRALLGESPTKFLRRRIP